VAFDTALFLGHGESPAWRHTLEKLRAARLYASEPRAGGPVVRFVSTNHFTFSPAAGGFSEVALTRKVALEVVGRDAERCRVLFTYGRDLLEVLAAPDEGEDTPRRRILSVVQEVLAPPGDAPAAATEALGAD
jgi:hypothetical protein